MSLTGLITFTAGTKAKASEVNTNFSLVKSFVDTNESNIATNTSDIETLTSGKADINGDATNRFAVADAVNDTDAVNKETLFKYTHNAQRYINGLQIAKTASDTVSVQSGSTFDSTFAKEMVLDSSMSIQNTSQGASTQYYVYLIAKEDSTTTCIISSDSVTPSLPSGYTYFRQIGGYYTDENSTIVGWYSTQSNEADYIIERTHGTNYVVTKYNTGYMEIEGVATSTTTFPKSFKTLISITLSPTGSVGASDYSSQLNTLSVTTTTPKYYTGFLATIRSGSGATTGYENASTYYRATGYFR